MNRRQFLKGIGLGISALSLAGCGGAFAIADSPKKPNIVLVVADDLGWNDIGYHNTEIRSSNIDTLAKTGVELNWHYVQPQCTPTRVALMTGRYPSRFGSHCTQASSEHAYSFKTPTIASVLKSFGYTTGCFGKWHMGSRPEWGPNHHGFDYSYGSLAGAVGMYDHRYRLKSPYVRTWHRNHELIGEEKGHTTDLVTSEAIKWIEKNKDKPFFCYVPYHSVHTPLVEEEKWLEMNRHIKDPDRRLMAAAVSHLDDCVGRIIEVLEQNRLRDNTLIIFVSDNGGIHGGYAGGNYPPPDPALKKGFSSNLPLKGGKTTVYEGGIRVPAFVNWKGTIPPSKNATVSHAVDWAPTLTNLAGAKLEKDPAWDGMDIWPFITGKEQPREDRQLYWVWGGKRNRVALRKGGWKLCRNNATKWELYNLADDPYETTDLAEDMPDRVEQLKSLIRKEKQKDNL